MKILIKTDNESKHMRIIALERAEYYEKYIMPTNKSGIGNFHAWITKPDEYIIAVHHNKTHIAVSVTKQNSTF